MRSTLIACVLVAGCGMMRVLIALVLAACGADSSKARVEPAPPVETKPAEGSAAAVDPVAIDAGAPGVGTVDAGTPQTRACFCFSWVHLDENGENCYETKPKCDAEFKGFGRDMKIECRAEQRTRCGGHACRKIGKECFSLY